MDQQYILDVRDKNNDPKRIAVSEDPIVIGSDNSADLCIKDEHLSPLHLKIRLQDDVLTLTQLGADHSTKLGRQKLKQGKMYIADKGDTITLGSVKLIIRQEKIEEKSTTKPEDKTEEISPAKKEVEKQSDTENTQTKIAGLSSIVRGAINKRNQEKSTSKIVKRVIKFENHLLPGVVSRFSGHFLGILTVICFLTYGLDYLEKYDQYRHFVDGNIETAKHTITKLHLLVIELLAKSPTPLPFELPGPDNINLDSIFQNLFYLEILLAYICFQIVSIILLGLEIPFFLMGIRSEGNFLLVRIKGLLRLLLGYLTLPLIIFDLPILLKKRSLKEVLTFSRLQYKRAGQQYISIMLIVPFFSLILIFLPLVFFLDTLTPPTVLLKQVVKKSKQESPIEKYRSKVLELELPFEKDDPPILATDINIKKKEINTHMLFIDEKQKTEARLVIRNNFDFNSFIPMMRNFDPLLTFHAPVAGISNETKLVAMQNEMMELIEDVLAFDPLTIHQFILNRGIFFYPYLKIRETILNKSKLPLGLEYDSYTQGNKTILVNRNKNIFLIQNHGMIQLELLVKGKNKKFIRDLLFKRFIPSHKFEFPKLNDAGKINSIEFFDLIWHLTQDMTIELPFVQGQMILYLLETGQNLIGSDQTIFKKHFLDMLVNLDKMILSLDKSKQKEYNELRLITNRIQKAVKENDKSFFRVNIKNTAKNLERDIKEYKKTQKNKVKQKVKKSMKKVKHKNIDTKQENKNVRKRKRKRSN